MSYTEGRQPCETYTPEPAPNVHECFGPYTTNDKGRSVRRTDLPACEGRVSFCGNCTTDHHSGGWDACPESRP